MAHLIARLALGFGALAAAKLGMAQDKLNHPSLEITVANAETVLVGRVIALSSPENGNSSVHFSVSVDEVIKGHAKGKVDLVFNFSSTKESVDWTHGASPLQRRFQSHEQCLWFLKTSGHKDLISWSSIPLSRSGPPRPADQPFRHWSEVAFDAGFGYPMFSEDLSVLTTKKTILEHARQFVKRHPGSVQNYELPVPGPVAERSGWTFAINHINVPLTEELQDTARRLIADPDFSLPKTWKPPTFFFDIPYGRTKETMAAVMRMEGIRALAGFKSNENIELLKRYLTDPGVEVAAWGEYKAFRSVMVREAAYNVLTGWHVTVPKPGTDEVTMSDPARAMDFGF